MKRPLAYITAPWSNSQYENAENAAAYCRQVYDAGYSPICPVLFLPTFLKDEIPQEHKDGLDMARDYLRRSHVLVVCGHGIDETVKNDIATAERLRITATTLDGIGRPWVQTRAEILPVSTTHWRRCPSVWKRSKISWRTFTSSRPQPRRK